jgi:hypothetical protein
LKKQRNKEIYFTGKFLPLATCLLMGDPRMSPRKVVIVVDDPSPFDPANDHVMQRTGSI